MERVDSEKVVVDKIVYEIIDYKDKPMTTLTRRSFALAGLGAGATFGLGAGFTPASAASDSATLAPALFGASLGAYRITAIYDGTIPLTRDLFFGPDKADMDAALAAAGVSGPALPVALNAYLLQSDTHTILIDSGLGEIEMFGPGFGRLSAGLAAAGVAPADVDLIIATHAHPDHIGGLVAGGKAVFANAEMVLSEVDNGFGTDAGAMARAPAEAQGMFALAQGVIAAYGDRFRPVTSGTEVAPGIRLELSPGHTPGHSVVHIDGGERQLLMAADTVLNADLQTALPETFSGFDIDPALAVKSRAQIFDRAAADGILIAATHVPFPSFGRFMRDDAGYRFIPASWI